MNRDSAIAAFSSHWPDDPVGAFTATMAWAYGERAGYAGYRVARILTASSRPEGREENPRVRTALRTSLEVAMRDGAVEGFSYLNDCTHKVKSHQGTDADLLVGVDCGRIYGLGPSFFTKWLHIGTLALSQESTSTHPPAPMLDSQATAWLNTHARIVDEDCLAQDESQKAAVIHRKWHADTSSPECTDHCLFLGAEEARHDAARHDAVGPHADGTPPQMAFTQTTSGGHPRPPKGTSCGCARDAPTTTADTSTCSAHGVNRTVCEPSMSEIGSTDSSAMTVRTTPSWRDSGSSSLTLCLFTRHGETRHRMKRDRAPSSTTRRRT